MRKRPRRRTARHTAQILKLAGVALMLLVILAVLPLTLPKLFGYRIYAALTSSMAPQYPAGCALYVRYTPPEEIAVGDVITFTLGTETDNVMTHRVLEIDTQNNLFITKGDANMGADATPVAFNRVLGCVRFSVPMLGAFGKWLRSVPGIVSCTAVFLVALLLWQLAARAEKKETKV